jgi:5-methylcytosine-specific restriction endonuclease McrA
MRICTKCNESKDLSCFGKSKNGPDGLNYWCKECACTSSRAWAEKNKERVLENQRKWYQQNADDLRRRAIERRSERLNESREYNREWKRRNIEKVRAYQKQYVQLNLDKFNCYNNNRRARLHSNGGTHTIEEWEMLCDSFGNLCLDCKQEKPLTKDHVIPISKGGTNDIWNIQPLCQSCNSRKGDREIDFRDFKL